MLGPTRRQDNRVGPSAMKSINVKVQTRLEIHLFVFPNTSARIVYIILRGSARKTTNLEEQDILREY